MPSLAFGQTNERIFEGLEWRLLPADARSAALGGATAGLTGSAPLGNPAGGSGLKGLELKIDTAASRATRSVVASSLQTADGRYVDTAGSFGTGRWLAPSSVSAALPLGRGVVTVFMNTAQDIHQAFQFGSRAFAAQSSSAGVIAAGAEGPDRGAIDATVRHFGASGAVALRPELSIGTSVLVSRMDIDSIGMASVGAGDNPTCPHAARLGSRCAPRISSRSRQM